MIFLSWFSFHFYNLTGIRIDGSVMQKGDSAMLKKLIYSGLILVMIFSAAGCSQPRDYVAKVNGAEIAREIYTSELDYELANFSRQGINLKEDELAQIKKYVLDRLINNVLLLDAAEQEGITPDSVDVESKLSEVRAQYENEEKFLAALEDNSFTIEEYTAVLAEIMAIEEYLDSQLDFDNVQVSAEEIKEDVDSFLAQYPDKPRDEVEEFFRSNLREEKINQLKGEFIGQLREASDIEYFDY